MLSNHISLGVEENTIELEDTRKLTAEELFRERFEVIAQDLDKTAELIHVLRLDIERVHTLIRSIPDLEKLSDRSLKSVASILEILNRMSRAARNGARG